MNKSESIKNIAKALASFQSEVQNPKNTADNPFFKSKYAPLQDILNDVRPLLAKHGLSVIQSPQGDGKNIVIETLLLHESGEWIEPEPLTLQADKANAQGAGSAITYGRRYALSAILGISSEDDDDGNHASQNNAVNTNQKNGSSNLTEKQLNKLYAIAKSNGHEPEAVKKVMMRDYNKTQAKDLTKSEYDELIQRMEKKGDKAS